MKIGGNYRLCEIGLSAWEKSAREWKLDPDEVADRMIQILKAVPNAMSDLDRDDDFTERLSDELIERVSALRKMFGS